MDRKRINLFVPEWQGYSEHHGTYEGAHWIRNELLPQADFLEVDVQPREKLTVDRGIVGVESLESVFEQYRSWLDVIHPDEVFTLGGTCALEIVPVSYLNDKYASKMAVIWFDAHGDLNTPESSPSGHFHGMSLRTLMGEGDQELCDTCYSHVNPQSCFIVGVRDLDPPEAQFAEQAGIHMIGCDQPVSTLTELLRASGYEHVYLHLDLDVLDPQVFDEVVFSVPGGMTVDHLVDYLQTLRGEFDVVGRSLLEFVPDRTPQRDVLQTVIDALGV